MQRGDSIVELPVQFSSLNTQASRDVRFDHIINAEPQFL